MTNQRPPEANPNTGPRRGRPRGRRPRGNNGRGNSLHDGRGREYDYPDDDHFAEEMIDRDEDRGDRMYVRDLKAMSMPELAQLAESFEIEDIAGLRKQDLIYEILRSQTDADGKVYAEGVLETLPDGFGFLRAPDYNYLAGPDDVYVSPSQIRKFDLHTGDSVIFNEPEREAVWQDVWNWLEERSA